MNRTVKAIGLLLALAACGYFVVHAYNSLAGQDLSSLLDAKAFAALFLLTALYSASISTTAAAWSWQLRAMRQPHAYSRFLAILASTQFGKYLPGNVGHHLGRIALANRSGVGLAAATLTISYELLLAILASAHISAFALLLAPPEALLQLKFFQYRWPLLGLISIGALVALVLAPKLTGWLLRLRNRDPAVAVASRNLGLNLKAAAFSYLMYVSSLSMIGVGLWCMAVALADGTSVPGPFFFIGAFAVSWIAGFVAPGAPAGLGVREMVLSAWLSQALPPAPAVVLIVALRIATTVGDLLNFAWGSALLLRQDQARAA